MKVRNNQRWSPPSRLKRRWSSGCAKASLAPHNKPPRHFTEDFDKTLANPMADTDSKDASGADATSRSPTSLAHDEPRGPDASSSHPDDGQSHQNQSPPSTTRFHKAPGSRPDLVVIVRKIVGSSSDRCGTYATLVSALDLVWEAQTDPLCNWSHCLSTITALEVEALKSLGLAPKYSAATAQQYFALVGSLLLPDWKERLSSSLTGHRSRSVSPD